MEDKKRINKKEILTDIAIILSAFILALGVRNFVFQPSKIYGTSMYPTFSEGQKITIKKFSTKVLHKELNRGEIIIIRDRDEGTLLIKRLIGLPGDELVIKNTGEVILNGKLLEEKYVNKSYNTNYIYSQKEKINEEDFKEIYAIEFPHDIKIKLKPDQYFFMGDNRLNSTDSRVLGPCSYSDIQGTVH